MAGKPLKQQVIKELERLAREDIGPQATALDYVCSWVESAESVASLADKVGENIDREFGRPWFSTLVNSLEPNAKQRIAGARKDSPHNHVDKATEILETAPTHDRVALEKAKERAKLHLWLAERYGKDTYGQQAPQAQVTLNVGSMHLDAFRAISQNTPQSPQVAPGTEIRALPAPDVAHQANPNEARG